MTAGRPDAMKTATVLTSYAAFFHQRLGQFISNILPNEGPPVYYVSDEDLVRYAHEYYEKFRGSVP